MKKLLMVAVSAMAFGVGGCATVLYGTNVDYATASRPEGAAVKFSTGETCVTPCELELRRKQDVRADLTLAGYDPTYVLVQSKLGGSAFGNIPLGGGVGAIVDGTNGASNRLYPRPLIVQLAPAGSGEGAKLLDKDGNIIMTVKQHNDSVREDVAETIGPVLAGLEGESGPQ